MSQVYPPHTQQPQGYSTTVVLNNQAQQPKPKREWRTGLFSCLDDIPICLMTCFCGPCYGCYLVTQADESCCLAVCCAGWGVPLRSYLRGKLGIQGSICKDICTIACCNICATCQMGREIKQARATGEWYTT